MNPAALGAVTAAGIATVTYLPGADGGQAGELARLRAQLDDVRADNAALLDELGVLGGRIEQVTAGRDQARAEVLAMSDALDQALRQRLDWWRDGYQTGFEAGAEVGAGQAARAWKVTVSDVGWSDIAQHGQSWAELDRKRYPPHGRLSWLLPNLGEVWAAWTALDDDADRGQP